MPSNEEKRMNGELGGRRTGSEEPQAYDIDALDELSAEDIESLLAEGAGIAPRKPAEREQALQGDVLEMLDDKEEDDDLWDIQDMLKKSDRNEEIYAEGMEDIEPEENPVESLLADIEGAGEEAPPLDARAKKAQEKQRKAEEKARLKEEKAAKREAAREEKAAKRELKKQKKKKPEQPQGKGQKEVKEYDLLADKDLLDSIVSDAGNLGREGMGDAPRKSAGFSVNELGEEYDASRERNARPEPVRGESLGAGMGDPGGSGIMEIDMDDIDAFIPEIGDAPKGGKKPKGKLFAKLVTMLMEEEEEPENENLSISKENQEIIRELDGEKAGGKGKKGKKAAKKEKKPKKEKPKKEPKPKKPKKEKKEKVKEQEPSGPRNKITFKKALPVLLLGATVGAVVFIFVKISTDFSVKQEAEAAFKAGDYAACYKNLYGKKLSEEQAQMLGKSESILYMEQKSRRYELFLKDGSERMALDSLFQTVGEYPAVYARAAEYGAESEVQGIYAGVLNVLLEKYGVSEADAQKIAAIESRVKYTRAVDSLVQGKGIDSAGAPEDPGTPEEGAESGAEALPDQLPEESELGEGNFSDN